MQTWEYAWISVQGDTIGDSFNAGSVDRMDLNDVLVKLGKEGWEIAGVGGGTYTLHHRVFFKRPKSIKAS